MDYKFLITLIVSLTIFSACREDALEEAGAGVDSNETPDNVKITLSQDVVNFSKDGGSASVTVTSNVPLSLEKVKDESDSGDLDMTPDDSYVIESLYENFFVGEGGPIKCDYTFVNNMLDIRVDKSEKRGLQSVSIPLYDMKGECQARVTVNLAGDPDIKLQLGKDGEAVVASAYSLFSKALSGLCYVERCYTGLYDNHEITCPLRADNPYCSNAYNDAYTAISSIERCAYTLENSKFPEAAPYFKLLNVILYTEMVNKWGRIGVVDGSSEIGSGASQQSAEETLSYIETRLDNISNSFTDRKADREYVSASAALDISKDVWRMAKANLHMARGQYSQAMPYLQQIVDSKRYSISAGNEHAANDGTILHLTAPDWIMSGQTIGYYTYTDVLLMLAECSVAVGESTEAASLINQVATKKGVAVSGNNIGDIDMLRGSQLIPGYFAFQKRNKLGKYDDYQYLWPIPYDQIVRFPDFTQNPGY